MTGENFKRLDRGSDVKRIKEKIQNLRNQWAKIYYQDAEEFNVSDVSKLEELQKKIEWQEYLLWGLTAN